ncbi:hypothetical protein EHQ58_06980 [Leptospira ognonensis]|uniref:Uncharacterized protein n=1 Tax=Leptospira ognonensis TaxID=2484945 RepID=A0A4R9K6H4_9LEPT|nr:hypothetical protein [Leptospira ognonensis]TGL60238.1 hypothetical protein EHQ58_06980 [Leptospira ognonensis]
MKKVYIIFAFVIFFGLSFDLTWKEMTRQYSIHSKKDLVIDVSMGSVKPIFAASSNWDGVRDIAKFTKDIVKGIDSILVNLASSNILSQTSTVTAVSGNYTFRYTPNFNGSVTSASLGAKTYKSSFEIWSGSGSTATKALELYFDSATDKSTGSGVLAIWQPNKFDTNLNTANKQIECSMVGGSANGTMVCSWNGPLESAGTIQAARIKVTANATAGTVSYKAAAVPVTSTTCSGGNADYYAIAFITKNVSPYYSTAKWGFNDNAIAATLCTTSNTTNNAYFNTNSNPSATDSTKYFVADGVTSDTNSFNTGGTLYPTIASVDSLFTEMTSGSDTDITTTKLGSMTIAFRSTAAP